MPPWQQSFVKALRLSSILMTLVVLPSFFALPLILSGRAYSRPRPVFAIVTLDTLNYGARQEVPSIKDWYEMHYLAMCSGMWTEKGASLIKDESTTICTPQRMGYIFSINKLLGVDSIPRGRDYAYVDTFLPMVFLSAGAFLGSVALVLLATDMKSNAGRDKASTIVLGIGVALFNMVPSLWEISSLLTFSVVAIVAGLVLGATYYPQKALRSLRYITMAAATLVTISSAQMLNSAYQLRGLATADVRVSIETGFLVASLAMAGCLWIGYVVAMALEQQWNIVDAERREQVDGP